MTAQTPAQRNASYRRRMAEKMARYEGALREIASGSAVGADMVAYAALKATDPAKS